MKYAGSYKRLLWSPRLLVVGLFSKGQMSAFISGTGRTTRRYGREGLGTRREKTILVPRAPVSFGHVVGETEGTNKTSSSGDENEKKPTTDSFVIFEDMPVSPATEKLIGQFKLCAWNGVKDLAINRFFICTRAALARYKLCFKT